MQYVGVARRPSVRRIRWRTHLEGYLFIAPWLIGFLLFTFGPMVASAVISFTNFDILTPARWAGLANYIRLSNDRLFFNTVYNTLFYTILAVPTQLLIALGLALLLNMRLRGVGVFRTLFYLPTVVPSVAGVLLWVMLLNPDFGLFNRLLWSIGLPGLPWLTDTTTAKPALVLIGLWYVGSQMLVFLAALQGVPSELYDAAHIDGANAFNRFRNVTLPMITPALFFNLVVGIINASQTFTLAFIGTGGGPANSTKFLVLYIYEQGFQSMRMGYASALAWALLLFILVLTVLQFRLSRWVYYEGAARA
jgi:multiple sugar transport system permease protein